MSNNIVYGPQLWRYSETFKSIPYVILAYMYVLVSKFLKYTASIKKCLLGAIFLILLGLKMGVSVWKECLFSIVYPLHILERWSETPCILYSVYWYYHVINLKCVLSSNICLRLIFVDKVRYIWTSGRLCDFDSKCDRPDLLPKSVNGWFWSSHKQRLAPTTDRRQNDWSSSGG